MAAQLELVEEEAPDDTFAKKLNASSEFASSPGQAHPASASPRQSDAGGTPGSRYSYIERTPQPSMGGDIAMRTQPSAFLYQVSFSLSLSLSLSLCVCVCARARAQFTLLRDDTAPTTHLATMLQSGSSGKAGNGTAAVSPGARGDANSAGGSQRGKLASPKEEGLSPRTPGSWADTPRTARSGGPFVSPPPLFLSLSFLPSLFFLSLSLSLSSFPSRSLSRSLTRSLARSLLSPSPCVSDV